MKAENKKGPPFGEPFLILRMVAPGVEKIPIKLIYKDFYYSCAV
ncbi:hypothetical protein [Pseudomonas putida]|nr:hypothetical protein [Pseudomonas putida]